MSKLPPPYDWKAAEARASHKPTLFDAIASLANDSYYDSKGVVSIIDALAHLITFGIKEARRREE